MHLTKFTVRGPDAAVWVDWIMANKLPRVGRMTLSVVCNERGGIDGEYTIVRHAENDFYLVSTPNAQVYNWDQLSRLLPDDGSVVMEDVSEQRYQLFIVAACHSGDLTQVYPIALESPHSVAVIVHASAQT